MFKVDLPSEGIRYRFALFENPHALPAVVVPPNYANGYPRYNGAPRPAPSGGKLWFADVLRDEEWLLNTDERARDEALRASGDIEEQRCRAQSDGG